MEYDRIRGEVAERLIRENGKAAYILVPGADTGPVDNPKPGEPKKELVYFLETHYSMTDRNQSLIQVGDVMGLISTETGVIPDKTNNSIEIDGVEYIWQDVKPLNPGGAVMLYKIHARKG